MRKMAMVLAMLTLMLPVNVAAVRGEPIDLKLSSLPVPPLKSAVFVSVESEARFANMLTVYEKKLKAGQIDVDAGYMVNEPFIGISYTFPDISKWAEKTNVPSAVYKLLTPSVGLGLGLQVGEFSQSNKGSSLFDPGIYFSIIKAKI